MPTIVVGQVTVPDVRGLAAANAEATLAAVFLTATYLADQASTAVEAGHVLFQSPAPGTDVDPESQVILTLSSGSGQVPAGASSQRKQQRRRFFAQMDEDMVEVRSEREAQDLFEDNRKRKRIPDDWDEPLYGDEYGDEGDEDY